MADAGRARPPRRSRCRRQSDRVCHLPAVSLRASLPVRSSEEEGTMVTRCTRVGISLSAVLLLGALTAVLAPRMVEGQAKAGGKILFAARQDIDTLDPHITNRAATRKILIQVLDTLTVINPQDGKVSAGLA